MEWQVQARTLPAEGSAVDRFGATGTITRVGIDKALAALQDLVRQTKPFIAAMGDEAPDSVTLTGDISLSMGVDLSVFTASGEGDFTVSMTWNKPQ